MRIQEISQKSGISKRNIHFYIKEGLLTPGINSENGYYDFRENDYERLCLIRTLRNAGLSLSIIRSLITKPPTAGYYLNIYVQELKRQRENIDHTIQSMNYILDHLPIHPDFATLYSLCNESAIPISSKSETPKSVFNKYDNSLVNLFLWSSFLPDDKFTDYQEFLWEKLNRLTETQTNEYYLKLYHFLKSLDQKSIDDLYNKRSQKYEYIASLEEKDFNEYIELLKKEISAVLKNEHNVSRWKNLYSDFINPVTHIFASDLGNIVAEISPLFASYKKNINCICNLFYDWLHIDEGIPLLQKIENTLGEYFDLESSNHGQLEALTYIFGDLD